MKVKVYGTVIKTVRFVMSSIANKSAFVFVQQPMSVRSDLLARALAYLSTRAKRQAWKNTGMFFLFFFYLYLLNLICIVFTISVKGLGNQSQFLLLQLYFLCTDRFKTI